MKSHESLGGERKESPLQEMISHSQCLQQADAAGSPAYLKSWKQATEVALLPLYRASVNSPGKPCWDKELSKKWTY